ncbi:MAG: ATP-dependent RNA helicase RhlB [Kiritimatiellia bacterium]|jgi:ATP-dependent RNA helicase RhlB
MVRFIVDKVKKKFRPAAQVPEAEQPTESAPRPARKRPAKRTTEESRSETSPEKPQPAATESDAPKAARREPAAKASSAEIQNVAAKDATEGEREGGQPRRGNRGGRNRSRSKGPRPAENAEAPSGDGEADAKAEHSETPADGETPRPRSRSRSRGGRNRSRKPREEGDQPKAEGSSAPEESTEDQADRPPKAERRPRGERRPEVAEAEVVPDVPWDPASYVVEEAEGKTRFADLALPEEILHALADLGFQYCTPIQAGILPHILKGVDGLGKAQTGTGKTAAFLITAFTKLLREEPAKPLRNGTPRVLVIAPTRELVIQIEEEAAVLGKYTGLTSMAVYGGLDYQKQKNRLENEQIDIVAATPGRLLDFRRSHVIHLGHVEVMVIDEADRMLDMGFIPDVRQIVRSTPNKSERQTLFFSATFNDDVGRLSDQWTTDPVRVEIEPESVAADTVEQRIYLATDREKLMVVYNIIMQEKPERVLIFANRRNQVRDLCETLDRYGISCSLLSGDVPQAKRVKTLERFKSGDVPVLVATDVAGRGLHVDGVSHVINYSLPDDPEDYVHRIGRTGRAGTEGKSISFASQQDAFVLPDIEKYLGRELRCEYPEEELLAPLPPAPPRKPRPAGESSSRPRSGGGRSGGGRSGGGRSGGGRSSGGSSRSR